MNQGCEGHIPRFIFVFNFRVESTNCGIAPFTRINFIYFGFVGRFIKFHFPQFLDLVWSYGAEISELIFRESQNLYAFLYYIDGYFSIILENNRTGNVFLATLHLITN